MFSDVVAHGEMITVQRENVVEERSVITHLTLAHSRRLEAAGAEFIAKSGGGGAGVSTTPKTLEALKAIEKTSAYKPGSAERIFADRAEKTPPRHAERFPDARGEAA